MRSLPGTPPPTGVTEHLLVPWQAITTDCFLPAISGHFGLSSFGDGQGDLTCRCLRHVHRSTAGVPLHGGLAEFVRKLLRLLVSQRNVSGGD